MLNDPPSPPHQRQVREQQRAHGERVHRRALRPGDDARRGDLALEREVRHAARQGALATHASRFKLEQMQSSLVHNIGIK